LHFYQMLLNGIISGFPYNGHFKKWFTFTICVCPLIVKAKKGNSGLSNPSSSIKMS
jgi:hypothetical protein